MFAQAAADIATNPIGINALIIYGPMGIMLAWFAMRAETKLERIVERIDHLSHKITGVTTALLTDVLSRESVSPRARQIAEDMLEKIERQNGSDGEVPPVKKRRSFTVL